MIDVTAKYVASESCTPTPGTIEGPEGRWVFSYDIAQRPLVSSQRKAVYRGSFSTGSGSHAKPISARALAFELGSLVAFGSECANLSLLSSIGVGPKLLAITQHDFNANGVSSPVIIEGDAGRSLALLLEDQQAKRSASPVLHEPGTHERALENRKILYDVYVQLFNAHHAGIYHRDLRCENVCVRRFGEKPADIRATIIDFDLSASVSEGRPGARAPLFNTLFSRIPSLMAGRHVTLSPNPLELDMGYLAVLSYHLYSDALLMNSRAHTDDELKRFIAYLDQNIGYFKYYSSVSPLLARQLNRSLDIDQLVDGLGLVPVNEASFASQQLLTRAQAFHRPYLDEEDMMDCMNGPEARLAAMIDRLARAKFETYKALRRKQGLEVRYERFEDQPSDLQKSSYAQAEHIPEKVRALGYLLVMDDPGPAYEEVMSFSDEQIEALARLEHDRWVDERLAAGWTLDAGASQGDPIAKTSPYLVPYDELEDGIREYDRDAGRQLIPLVKSAGLMVVRPK